MKRLFSVLVLAAVMCLPMQADTYHDLFVRYMATNDVMNTDQYSQQLGQILTMAFPDEPGAAQCFSEYFQTQFIADMTAMYEPAFRKHLTEAELGELVALNADPKFAELQRRSMEIVRGLQQRPEFVAFTTQYAEAIEKIMKGEKPRDVQIADEVSSEYAETFTAFYRSSGIDELLMSTFQGLFSNLEQQMRMAGMDSQALIGELMAYTSKNMPKMLMSIYSETLTQEDLRLLMTTTERPAYKHSMKAVTEVVSDPIALGVQLILMMANWMVKSCPDYAAPLQEVIKSLEALGK